MDGRHSYGRGYIGAAIVFIACLVVMAGALMLASLVQTDFGRVEVSNVVYRNYNGIQIRAKLLKPIRATEAHPAPGIVYVHGYQNNRETSDPYCIELARRGFAVLEIDAIGRGNSGVPDDPRSPGFDKTYGTATSLDYIRSLPFVSPSRVGMMGHSLGAEMAYAVALRDASVKALVISGFAYTKEASRTNPLNLLMIFGKWDEYRKRMTGTRDFEGEWMGSELSKRVIPADNPKFGVTYGDFSRERHGAFTCRGPSTSWNRTALPLSAKLSCG